MNALLIAVMEAGEHAEHGGGMPFPPYVFGIIALVALGLLVGVTLMFRNTAHGHDDNEELVPFEPFVHAKEGSH